MAGEFKVKNGIKFSDNSVQSAAAQPVLVSGTSIKTINNESILGSGNISISGTAGPLNDLTDVTITSPSNGQVLKYNGTAWVNDTDNSGSSGPLNDLTDVTITSPSNGQVLKYNGTAWVNDTDSGGISLTSLSVTDAGGDGSLSYNNTTGVFTYTGPSASEVRAHFTAGTGISITNGTIDSTITQYTNTDARGAISVTDAGGDGSLSYNSTTGVFTYTGPGASEVRAHFTAGTGITITDGAIAVTGVVTSVTGTSPVVSTGTTTPAISLASGYGDTQNPYASKTANYFLAAPNGTAGTPSFRAIVAADIPTLNQNTTGTASNVTGTVAIANGGTGQTTAQAAINALLPSQTSNSGKYLTTDGTNVSWAATTTTSAITTNSVYFDGNGDYLSIANNSAFITGSQDFTYEAWIYPTSIPNTYQSIISKRTALANYASLFIGIKNTGKFSILVASNSTTWGIVDEASADATLNRWQHIAAVKNGSNFSFYVDGIRKINTTINFSIYDMAANQIIGAGTVSGDQPFFGFISNIRIVKGTAVYTNTFDPPTAPLTEITNTSLLTCQASTIIDSSSNNFTITAAGNSAVSSFAPSFTSITPTAKYTRTLEIPGQQVIFNGTKRWWIHSNFTITKVFAYVTSAPTGSSLGIRINKNGASATTLTISAGQTKASSNTGIVVAQDDYVTVDITTIGLTTPGENLTLIIQYE